MRNSAVDFLKEKIQLEVSIMRADYNNGVSVSTGISLKVLKELLKECKESKEIEEEQRKNDFIGGYLTHAMKKNKLPYGIKYLNKVADIEKEADELYKRTVKRQNLI